MITIKVKLWHDGKNIVHFVVTVLNIKAAKAILLKERTETILPLISLSPD